MVNREKIKEFIAEIKQKTGLKQFEISKEAGWEPKTLGQLISKGVGLQEVFDQLNRVFAARLKNSPSPQKETFSADQLFAMFLEVSGKQTDILRSIESKMAQEQTQATIRKAVEKIEASLPALLNRQDSGFGIVIELLKRDALREAGGNQEKADQILREIVQRIGPDLSPKLRESIRADGHT